ncbi:MAG: ABC transporter ATP-binding protein [Clostridia bacterium]|nr:ABC transporter ATP-binding protein [Clostridia bacterium]
MIKIEGLYKAYGKNIAVNHLDLSIGEGEIFGFVGPNGAGKTTTLKVIATLLMPDSGKVLIDDKSIYSDIKGIRSSIGYMPDFFGVYENLTSYEYLSFFGEIAGLERMQLEKTIDELLELVNLVDKKHEMVDGLSRGMKQRLCLARALVHNPKILLLDEPASGLDPRARVQMKDILKELKHMGKTVIISSHILPELAELCSTIGIINKGKIVQKGTVEEINDRVFGASPIKMDYIENEVDVLNFVKAIPSLKVIQHTERSMDFLLKGSERDAAELLKSMVHQGIAVTSFRKMENNLESLFMELTGGEDNA